MTIALWTNKNARIGIRQDAQNFSVIYSVDNGTSGQQIVGSTRCKSLRSAKADVTKRIKLSGEKWIQEK